MILPPRSRSVAPLATRPASRCTINIFSTIYASVEDLARFGSFHAGALMAGQRAVLPPRAIAAMQMPGLGDYGLGWQVNRSWTKHTIVWHSGAMPGSSTAQWLVPAERIAIAVVANQIAAPVNQLAGEILAALVPTGSSTQGSQALPEAPPAAPAPSEAVVGGPTGRYRGTISTCPTPEAFAIEIRNENEIAVTLGRASSQELDRANLTPARLSGTFEPAGSSDILYTLDLRVVGERLRGALTRRASLGPRANTVVTLWADLERER